MVIDEEEQLRPTKYAKKVTRTDHNSIIVDVKLDRIASNKGVPFFNTKCQQGKVKFQEEMQKAELDDLFIDVKKIDADYK